MDCSVGRSILSCSISKGSQIIYSHCPDLDLETLATDVLQTAPRLHSRYSHTIDNRTFAFLFDGDGHIYSAIADTSACAFHFLELMRNGYRATKNGVHEELIPAVRRLIASLETLSHPLQSPCQDSPAPAMITTAAAPLLTKSSGDEETEGAQGMWIDMAVRSSGSGPLQKSLSARAWMQQNGRRLWWWHVKLVIAVDLLLCLVLFGIWLGVCRGFQCVA